MFVPRPETESVVQWAVDALAPRAGRAAVRRPVHRLGHHRVRPGQRGARAPPSTPSSATRARWPGPGATPSARRGRRPGGAAAPGRRRGRAARASTASSTWSSATRRTSRRPRRTSPTPRSSTTTPASRCGPARTGSTSSASSSRPPAGCSGPAGWSSSSTPTGRARAPRRCSSRRAAGPRCGPPDQAGRDRYVTARWTGRVSTYDVREDAEPTGSRRPSPPCAAASSPCCRPTPSTASPPTPSRRPRSTGCSPPRAAAATCRSRCSSAPGAARRPGPASPRRCARWSRGSGPGR